MTDNPADTPAGKTPQVQSGVKADTPRAAEDPYGLARELRAQAAAIEAAAPPSDEWVNLKVGPPHTSFGYGGVVVGSDWTPVHVTLAPGVLNSASETPGVTVTQEGS